MFTPVGLTTEYRTDPLGIDTSEPRLSWRVDSDRRGARQTAYRVLVASRADLLEEGLADKWDSGRVEGDRHVAVEYAGAPVVSAERCHWTVRVWDDRGEASSWAHPAWFETALLADDDWDAELDADSSVTVDGDLLTARGPGSSTEAAQTLLEALGIEQPA